jgi:hypothetical protein
VRSDACNTRALPQVQQHLLEPIATQLMYAALEIALLASAVEDQVEVLH